ncbi:MAG: Gx transporter family protein [Clostridiales bacterium]|nr:Gx transporter family protein [Clostridiales bacterium]
MKKEKRKNIAIRTAVMGILGAVALALSFLESLIPDIAFLPPGAKLGLSNIAVMFAALTLSCVDGLFIVLLKSGFVFLTRGAASFFMSFSGGMLSYIVLVIAVMLSKKLKTGFSYIGISVICAVFHNVGQVAAASIYTKTNLAAAYLPLLIIFGIFSGVITGIILRAVMPVLVKYDKNNVFGNF